ncbi:hypothetical protein Acor_21160 [Acrocarpospora corrugata]|uniref:NACHT N-terminal Helical domain-containing protein n=1 Tax=Acrocarpospora corrugata TaxID=35763 RepID=A0A5M3VY97_9ACTN|nr:hypothetical protein [Acrocarpospora corrugata]GES00053.1 hypothetical protein Acor_21160 [Acrocarpospora corrugata]
MAKQFSYAEAVRILGGETRTLRALDKVLGGALLGAAALPGAGALALSLFDAKAEAVRLGHHLIGSLREKVTGTARHTRTERLLAAQAIITATAFFEALDDIELPFRLEDLDLTYAEQLSLLPELNPDIPRLEVRDVTSSSDADLPQAPTPFHAKVSIYRVANVSLLRFVRGLAVWEGLTATQKDQARDQITKVLPEAAARRYHELYRQLAVEFPEFAFWTNQGEHHATQHQLQHGLTDLTAMLDSVASGRVPPAKLRSILALNQGCLARTISPGDELPDGLALPSLADGYINPRFRLLDRRNDLSLEESWAAEPVRDDLQHFLAAFVTSISATKWPLLALGQPGVGKSVLVQMLAARLPSADYLPVRVPLRQVPADAGIQEQIEAAIRVTTGESMTWPDLARSTEGALPVIMLDGLDELLQATGVNRADYLIQAAEFQTREAELGRPVVVIVTTRTAVSDRCRLPAGTIAIRLEPFSNAQVKLWIDIWNKANTAHFLSQGRTPLSSKDVLAHQDLAEQPLLLLMLALYDADSAFPSNPATDGALHGASTLRLGELYERLLHRFAAREVDKHERGLSPQQREAAIQRELLRLSVAAFAMFNRGQQWVTREDLDRDLTALIPDPPTAGTGFQRPLTAAQTVIGRFFFIHQARALQDSEELSTYEFLHATFGEYLIARLVHELLRREAERDALDRGGLLGGILTTRQDSGPLAPLLSFAVLSVRAPIPQFLNELAEPGHQLKPLLLRRFQEIYFGSEPINSAYEPQSLSAVERIARQTANLVLLTTVLAGPVTATELFGAGEEAVRRWQHLVDLWRAGTQHDGWSSLVSTLGIARSWGGDDRVLTLFWKGSHRAHPGTRTSDLAIILGSRATIIWEAEDSLAWAYNQPPTERQRKWRALPAQTSLDIRADHAMLTEALGSGFGYVGAAATFIASTEQENSTSLLAALNNLWLPIDESPHPQLIRAFERVFDMLATFPDELPWEYLDETLDRLVSHLPNLTTWEVSQLLNRALNAINASNGLDLFHHAMITCALDLVARDRGQLELLGRVLYELDLPPASYLEAAVTLMELEIDPSEVPVTAFDVVRRLSPDEMADMEDDHPHLFHRARRIIRADGGRYRLVWPG